MFPTCPVSYATVRRDIRQQRHPAPTTSTLDLVWHPGEAPGDFGQADVYVAERRVRAHYLCMTFPYSNAGYLPWFRGENAECVVHGLVTVCTHLGGAPCRLVFDNASGVGHRRGDTVHLTELFQRCQAHYGFETTFCHPAAGYEKGNVENKVGQRSGFFHQRVLHAVALAFEQEEMAVVRQPVNHRGRYLVVGEHGPPLRELEVRRHNEDMRLVTVRHHPEQQRGAFPVHREVGPLIQDEQVRPAEVQEDALQGPRAERLTEAHHQVGEREEPHREANALSGEPLHHLDSTSDAGFRRQMRKGGVAK